MPACAYVPCAPVAHMHARGTHRPPTRAAVQTAQVALIASCDDDDALRQIAATGKIGDRHGVSAAAIGRRVVLWCEAAVERLCMPVGDDKALERAAARCAQVRLALRLRRGEREGLLLWMAALRSKHDLPAALLESATASHTAACKALKKACKKAAAAAATAAAAPAAAGGEGGTTADGDVEATEAERRGAEAMPAAAAEGADDALDVD